MSSKSVKVTLKPGKDGRTRVEPSKSYQSVSRKIAALKSRKTKVVRRAT